VRSQSLNQFRFFFYFKIFLFLNKRVIIIGEQRFGAEAESAQKSRIQLSPLSRRPITSRDCRETAFYIPIVSIGRRPLSYINLSITTTTLLQAPNSNTIYLGIFEPYSYSYQSIFPLFSVSEDFKNLSTICNRRDKACLVSTDGFFKSSDLAKEATHNTLWNLKPLYWWIIAPLPKRILDSNGLKKTIMEDSYGIDL